MGFLSIPSYDEVTLAFSALKSKEYHDRHFTIKGFSREMILGALGEAEADRVYPQMKGQEIPMLNDEVTMQMERVAMTLITSKGWAHESEILEQIKLHFRGQQHFKETQIKRMLPGMYEKYCLKQVRLNKELKDKFGITSKGYPSVIIWE